MTTLRTIVTTGAAVVEDVKKLYVKDLTYAPEAKCLKQGLCKKGWGEHEFDCPFFEDNSHAESMDDII